MSQIHKIVTLKKYGFFKKVTTTYPLPLLNFMFSYGLQYLEFGN